MADAAAVPADGVRGRPGQRRLRRQGDASRSPRRSGDLPPSSMGLRVGGGRPFPSQRERDRRRRQHPPTGGVHGGRPPGGALAGGGRALLAALRADRLASQLATRPLRTGMPDAFGSHVGPASLLRLRPPPGITVTKEKAAQPQPWASAPLTTAWLYVASFWVGQPNSVTTTGLVCPTQLAISADGSYGLAGFPGQPAGGGPVGHVYTCAELTMLTPETGREDGR